MEKWIFKLQTNGDMTTEWNGRFLTIWTANKNKQKTALKSKSIYMYYNILFFKLEDNYNIVMVSAIRPLNGLFIHMEIVYTKYNFPSILI